MPRLSTIRSRRDRSSRSQSATVSLQMLTLFLAKRPRRVEASGARGRNCGGHQAGRNDDQQTHGVGDRIEDVDDLANGGGVPRG